jgi:hypothetical protein
VLWNTARARLIHLWAELGVGQDKTAKAAKNMPADAKGIVPFLRERLQIAAKIESRAVALIPLLDNNQFQVREKATKELQKLGGDAAFALQLALLRPSLTLESQRRIETLLSKAKQSGVVFHDSEPRSIFLALSILEELNTDEAVQVLRTVAAGPDDSSMAQLARSTLQRLGKVRKSPKRGRPHGN